MSQTEAYSEIRATG